ncbi:hypothetical protein [Sorangium sp. So ce385]|uniref:hypothetical protein n=1 Tax=Sorangium sp. So ce385 TaxID=3133308 RepID=UPI003F5C96C2
MAAEILLRARPERVARQPLEAEASMRIVAHEDDAHLTMLPAATVWGERTSMNFMFIHIV